MTIPSRPAPGPPRASYGQAGANASIERLRVQLQQQQQQYSGIQRLKIRLPPPPPKLANCNNNGFHAQEQRNGSANSTAITRKFPTARIVAGNVWDSQKYDNISTTKAKKIPPPRPPPPKINSNRRKATAPPPPPQPTSVNILSSIFQRKKHSKTSQSTIVYGLSTGGNIRNQSNTTWQTSNSMTKTTTNYSAASTNTQESLISFDSPPNSPMFVQKSNSDCLSVNSFSSDSNFSSPNNGSAFQPESGFEDDLGRTLTKSPLDSWETLETFTGSGSDALFGIGTASVRNLSSINALMQNNGDNTLCNGKSLLPPAPSLHMPTIIKPKVTQKLKAPKPPYVQPIAGVSLFDSISHKVDELKLEDCGATAAVSVTSSNLEAYGIALFNFDGVEDGDLCFRENEKIFLLEQMSPEWYRGRLRSGCVGIFPANYIDIKVPLKSAAETYPSKYSYPTARCLYNFTAEVETDLALKENDVVTVYYKINGDWLYGEINGHRGQFPANFIEYIPENTTPMLQT